MAEGAVVHLRPSIPADAAFLSDVYASTREEELAPLAWDGATKAAFLAQQFHAQDVHYRTHYTGAEFLVVMADDQRIGRIYVDRGADEIRVMDIALLPVWRGRGIGNRLLDELLAEAAATGRRVTLYVEANNPARRLYARLGFVQVEKGPVYDLLEWRSP